MATTKYTANIDYPTHYFRAWMTYEIADNEATYSVSVRYGIALHDSYVSQSWDSYTDRYVAVSTSGAKTTDTGWIQDSTTLNGSGSNWWHQTGSTSISVTKTTSAQSLTLKLWGKVGSGTQETVSVNLSIPKKDDPEPTVTKYTVAYNSNGGFGSCITSLHTSGVSQELEPNHYERPGYHFKGWALTQDKADAGTVDYANGATMGTQSTINNAVINLYAVWEEDPNMWSQIGGTWTKLYQGWVQIGGTWKPIDTAYIQLNGEWKNILFLKE